MRDDLTSKFFDGVTRMIDASTRSILVSVKEMVDTRLSQLPHGPAGPTGSQGERGPEGVPGRDGRDALPVPGPQGSQGEKGMNGRDGKDGKDSDITKDQLEVAVEKAVNARMDMILKSIDLVGRDLVIADRVIKRIPVPIYRDVFRPDHQYEWGDMVTFGGSTWHCNNPTTEKPGVNGDWTLAVKHGRDAK